MNTAQALKVIEENNKQEMLWRTRAVTLLQFIGAPGVDLDALQKKARELVEQADKL